MSPITRQRPAACRLPCHDRWHRRAALLRGDGRHPAGAGYHFDLVRPGVGLYGGDPFVDAKPVVTLSLPVVQTREVKPGESRWATAITGPRHGRRAWRRWRRVMPTGWRGRWDARGQAAALGRRSRLPGDRPHLDGPDHRRCDRSSRTCPRRWILNARRASMRSPRLAAPSDTKS